MNISHEENLFKSFAFKRCIKEYDNEESKKQKQIDPNITQHLISPNIFVLSSEKKYSPRAWLPSPRQSALATCEVLVSNPAGYILYQFKIHMNDIANILDLAISNNCTVVTYDKIILSQECFQVLNHELVNAEYIYSLTELSDARCGLLRVDGKRYLRSHQEIYTCLCGKYDTNISTCESILQSFIKGRLNGWW